MRHDEENHEVYIFCRLSQCESEAPNMVQLCDNFSLQGMKGVDTVLVHDVLEKLPGVGRKHTRTLCRQITYGLAELYPRDIYSAWRQVLLSVFKSIIPPC